VGHLDTKAALAAQALQAGGAVGEQGLALRSLLQGLSQRLLLAVLQLGADVRAAQGQGAGLAAAVLGVAGLAAGLGDDLEALALQAVVAGLVVERGAQGPVLEARVQGKGRRIGQGGVKDLARLHGAHGLKAGAAAEDHGIEFEIRELPRMLGIAFKYKRITFLEFASLGIKNHPVYYALNEIRAKILDKCSSRGRCVEGLRRGDLYLK